jgi:hypothetical protein
VWPNAITVPAAPDLKFVAEVVENERENERPHGLSALPMRTSAVDNKPAAQPAEE